MPNTIPYDPSLTMGNIVHPLRVSILEKIAAAQAPVTAAETNLNSLITLKRSLDATIREMLEMGVDVTALIQEGETVKAQIQKAAIEYGNLKMIAEKGVQLLRSTIRDVHSDVESPLDYNRSEIKNMPLGNNSMQLNVQYFSCETNTENGTSHAADISSFVNHALSFLGTHNAQQMSLSVQQQINMQLANHKIAGTLVISISCTHRDARIFAPLNIDVDKAVRAWNYIYPEDKIKTNSPLQSIVAEMKEETLADPAIYILSGATFGSSLVGMVHILNNTTTISMESMSTIASQIQEKMNMGAWVSSLNGEFGVTSSFATDVKNMLSTQNLQSHCSLVTMGIIPTLKSNIVKSSVMQFVESDKENPLQRLAQLQGMTAEENNTMASGARKALTGKQMVELRNASITASIAGLSKMEEQENSIININSMMTAMDDYIEKCVSSDENVGIPINYFLKPLNKSGITRAWLNHYYPNAYNMAGSLDDSKPKRAEDNPTLDDEGTD